MPQRDYEALRDALMSLRGDIAMLRGAFATADVGPQCADPHRHNREWCAVYLNDTWHRFCRRLVLSSAILEPRTLSGTLVPRAAGLQSERDVLARLRQLPGPRRPPYWEPRWHDAVQAVTAARFLRVANGTQIAAALGSTPSPAADLNTVRNFVAHRNNDTAARLRVVLGRQMLTIVRGTSSRAIVDALLSAPSGTGTRFLDWCDQMEQIAIACVA